MRGGRMEKTNEMDENKAQMDARAKLLDCEEANAERGKRERESSRRRRRRRRRIDRSGGRSIAVLCHSESAFVHARCQEVQHVCILLFGLQHALSRLAHAAHERE